MFARCRMLFDMENALHNIRVQEQTRRRAWCKVKFEPLATLFFMFYVLLDVSLRLINMRQRKMK